MINIVVSVETAQTDDLKRTLSSIGDTKSQIIVIISNKVADVYDPEEIRKYTSFNQDIICIQSAGDNHMKNFYAGLHSEMSQGDIITFLKAGDFFSAAPFLNSIEQIFEMDSRVMIVSGRTQSALNISLYHNDKITLQGKFFKRQFIDYYTFLEDFTNEIEFALNLHYISETQKSILQYIDATIVYTNSPLSDIGLACHHYFDEIVPYQDFFNNNLTVKYIYHLMTECYFSYIEAVNLQVPEETLDKLMRDIYTFYNYFRQLELVDDKEELVLIYNQGILNRYGMSYHPFTRDIPCIHLLQFLDILEENLKEVLVDKE